MYYYCAAHTLDEIATFKTTDLRHIGSSEVLWPVVRSVGATDTKVPSPTFRPALPLKLGL